MSKSIDDVKQRISQDFLGRAGIHGVGIRRSEDAIYLYVTPQRHPDRGQVMDEIRKIAAPFRVTWVEADAPTIS
jgi:hypothetical protein